MLIRNEKQIAFDQVNRLLRLSGDEYREASARIDRPELTRWFALHADERERQSQELEDEIRRLGDLPSRPDPDKEMITNLLVGIREAFSHDPAEYELQHRAALENELAKAIEEALRLNDDEAMGAKLSNLARQAEHTRDELRQLMAVEKARGLDS